MHHHSNHTNCYYIILKYKYNENINIWIIFKCKTWIWLSRSVLDCAAPVSLDSSQHWLLTYACNAGNTDMWWVGWSQSNSSDWSMLGSETNRFKLSSVADNSTIFILSWLFVPALYASQYQTVCQSGSVWDTSLTPQLVPLLPNPSFTPRMQ